MAREQAKQMHFDTIRKGLQNNFNWSLEQVVMWRASDNVKCRLYLCDFIERLRQLKLGISKEFGITLNNIITYILLQSVLKLN